MKEVTKRIKMKAQGVDWIQHHGELEAMRVKFSNGRALQYETYSRSQFDAVVVSDSENASVQLKYYGETHVFANVRNVNDSEWFPRVLIQPSDEQGGVSL